MKRDTSKEKEVLLAKDLPTRERSACSSPSTKPQAPTKPSRQFHSIPYISRLRCALAAFLCAMLLLNLAIFSSKHEFWYLFFLISMTTRSKAEAGSYWLIVCSSTLLNLAEPSVDSSSFFSFKAKRSFYSLAFLNFKVVISRRMRSRRRELDSQELMHFTYSFFSTILSSLASSIDCRLAYLSLISFCNLPIFSSKEQIRGTNSSTSISLSFPPSFAFFLTSFMYCFLSSSTPAID